MDDDLKVFLYGGSGTDNGSYRYRILNLKEQLDLAGINSHIVINLSTIEQLSKKQNTILVLHRTAWDYEVSAAKKFAMKNSIPLVYDIDDYVFDPSINKYVRGIEFLNEEQKKEYVVGVSRYRKTLLDCDLAIASTQYLADRITKNGIRSFVHRNSLSTELLSISEKVREQKHKKDGIVLGYFSGTHTHNYDFKECSDALLQILEEFKGVKLLLVGPLEIDPRFNRFSNRIVRSDLVHWKKLPELIASVDINLAPLEISNPFCQAKSELKYFEAALVNVPTIASPTESFQYCIKNYENGFLASNKEQWIEFLRLLITDENLRRKIAKNAMVDSYERYTNVANSKTVGRLFREILDAYHSPKSLTADSSDYSIQRDASISLKISCVTGTPEPNQGGFQNITRNCQYLSKFGHSVTLYVDPGLKFQTEEDIKKFLEKYYGPVNYSVKYGHVLDKCDVLIATFWTTAYNNVAPSNVSKTKMYFVQDFEPYFYQMGPEYIMAEKSYQLGLYHITSFPWISYMIKQRYGGKADYYLPPIDRTIYTKPPNPKKRQKLQIVFYGRPDQPRRCYDLGIQALSIVYEKTKNLDIVIFGSNKIDSAQITFPHINKGTLPKLSDLADLYQNSDIGIVFSTTNPSLLSFEMMACGCPVVDLDLEANRLNYGSTENAILCEPTPSGVANKILELIQNEQKRRDVAENGYRHSLLFPDIEGTARQVEALILKAHLDKDIKNNIQKHSDSIPDIIITRNEMNLGEILPGRTIKQSFISQSDGLHEILFYFGTYARKNTSHLSISLYDAAENLIARSELNAKDIQDNSWHQFTFHKITSSKDSLFYLRLSSNDAEPGNAVTVYATKQNIGKSCRLYLNNTMQKGSLCFQTFCQPSYEIKYEENQKFSENNSTDELLDKLSQKLIQRKSKQNLLEQRTDSIEETVLDMFDKLNSMEDKVSSVSESLSQTKIQLNKLDSTIYRFSQVLPIRLGVQLLRKFTKK